MFESILQQIFSANLKVVFIPVISSLLVLFFLSIYRFIYPKKDLSPVLFIILITLPVILNLFRPGTYQSGDLSLHTEYFRAFFENITVGIFIPQWAADFCAGKGCPVFLFAYTLPYYLASLFHLVGFSYLESIKIILALGFIGAGISMYYFAKEELGNVAGFVASVFYIFAPFHLIDTHFRGSVGEVLSYLFIPLVFLFTRKIIVTGKLQHILLNTLLCVLLLFSHASTTFSIIPLLIVYAFITLKKNNKKIFSKRMCLLICSYLLAVCLSAYYWLPAFAENKFSWHARYGATSYYEPIQNYLFSPAGFGFLFQGNHGEYRLLIGYMHLVVIVFAVIFLFIKKKTFFGKQRTLLIILLSFFFGYFCLMQTFAKPIWDNVHLLDFFLMVWRLLIPIGFVTALIAGIIVSKLKNIKYIFLICLLTIFSTILNWGNRTMVSYNPNNYYTHVDEYTEYTEVGNPFYDKIYKEKSKHFYDLASQKYHAAAPIETISGEITYKQILSLPNEHRFIINVTKDAVIKENTFYFPGWQVRANEKQVAINYKHPSEIGIITFALPKGLYKVDVIFADTKIRNIGKLISIMALIFFFIFLIYHKRNYVKKAISLFKE